MEIKRDHHLGGRYGQPGCQTTEDWNSDVSDKVFVQTYRHKHNLPDLLSLTVMSARCLIWEGGWNPELVTEAADMNRRGVYGKIILSVCGEVSDKILKNILFNLV